MVRELATLSGRKILSERLVRIADPTTSNRRFEIIVVVNG
jgi:hypothetical protein